jgi:hypothetical protein
LKYPFLKVNDFLGVFFNLWCKDFSFILLYHHLNKHTYDLIKFLACHTIIINHNLVLVKVSKRNSLRTGGVVVRHLLVNQRDGGSNHDAGDFYFSEMRLISRDSYRLGKVIFPENSSLGTSTPNFLKYSGLGK